MVEISKPVDHSQDFFFKFDILFVFLLGRRSQVRFNKNLSDRKFTVVSILKR